MNTSKYRLLSLSCLIGAASLVSAEECTFNGFNDGGLHEQQGWWSDKADTANQNFLVVDHLGITQTVGDKALVISGSEGYMKVTNKKNTITWKPGDVAIFEMDFQIGLNGGHVTEAQNGLAILFGEPTLNVSNRWVFSLGISPEGHWLIRGNMPHWENLPRLEAETFVSRPGEGLSSVSKWFHMKLTALKDTQPNVFRVQLSIADTDGNIIFEHVFKDAPLDGDKASLWRADTLNFGFSAKDNINGLVCLDNVNLSVIAGERKVTSLKDLL